MNKRNTRKVLNVVSSALNVLRSKKNWVQFQSAANEFGYSAVPGSKDACRFCVTGAIRHFAKKQASASDPRGVVESLIASATEEVRAAVESVSKRSVLDLVDVNDGPSAKVAHRRIVRGLRVARRRINAKLAKK